MGMVKRALDKGERRLEQTYPMYSERGVMALLNHFHTVWGEVYRGNYDALIIMMDLGQALEDAYLTDKQLMAVDLVFIKDFTPREAAALMGVAHEQRVRAYIEAAAKKIAKYLGETEGYADGTLC